MITNPIQLSFSLLGLPEYFDPAPASLVDFVELFDSDAGQFTKYSEGTPGSTSIINNKYIIDHSGAQNDIVVRNNFSYSIPQAFIQIQVDSQTGTPSVSNEIGVGLFKDADNFIVGKLDQVADTASIQAKVDGVSHTLGSVSFTFPSTPFKIALGIVGNSICLWIDSGSGWTYITGYYIVSYYDLRTPGNLTDWHSGLTLATGGGTSTVNFSNFRSGRFGGVAMRDLCLVTNEDGSPYIFDSTIQFTATVLDPLGYPVVGSTILPGYLGVFSFNFVTKQFTQTAVIMFLDNGKVRTHYAAHIIRYTNGDRRIFVSTWGNESNNPLQILHGLLTTGDILTGTNLVAGLTALSLPGLESGYAPYDPMVVYDADNSRWLIAYTITTNIAFPTGCFYSALASSSDLSTFTLIGADTANQGYEGTRILKAFSGYWVLSGGFTTARVYNDSMAYQGNLNAIIDGGLVTKPHPTVFQYDSNTFYLLTFDQTKYNATDWTWGRPTLQRAFMAEATENDLSADSDCLAYWRLEGGALTVDSKGSNTLTNVGSIVPDTTNFYEGAGSALFTKKSNECLSINDADLPAGFPLKSGDIVKKGSWFFCFRPTDFSTNYICPGLSKWDWNGQKLSLSCEIVSSIFRVNWGYNTGQTQQYFDTLTLTLNHWYAAAISFDGVNKILEVFLYDQTTGAFYSYYYSPTNELRVVDTPLLIGSEYGGTSMAGQIDSVIVFNRPINNYEFMKLALGSYTEPLTIADAINNPDFDFTYGGTGKIEPSNDSHDWVASLYFGYLLSGQNKWLQATVNGPGRINFWWTVDCSSYMQFFVDDVKQAEISGSHPSLPWSYVSIDIPDGPHILKWNFYGLSGSGHYGAFLDEVEWGLPVPDPATSETACEAIQDTTVSAPDSARSDSVCEAIGPPTPDECLSITTAEGLLLATPSACYSQTRCEILGLDGGDFFLTFK